MQIASVGTATTEQILFGETGGSKRGAYIDLVTAGNNFSSNIWHSGNHNSIGNPHPQYLTLAQYNSAPTSTAFPPSYFASVSQNQLVAYSLSGSSFVPALADGSYTQHVVGIADVANFRLITYGLVSGYVGIVIGQTYWLSGSVPGSFTSTQPLTNILKVATGESASTILFDLSGGGTPLTSTIGKSVNQVAHGFSIGNVVYYNGTAYALTTANTVPTCATALGIISQVPSPDTFTFVESGYIQGLTGLVANTRYYCSTVTGALTATPPPIAKPMLLADSNTSGYVLNWPVVVNGQLAPTNTQQVSVTAVNAVADNWYFINNVATTTVIFPAAAQEGDTLWVTVTNNLLTNVINNNGLLIQGLNQNMILNVFNNTVRLQYKNLSWRLV